MKKYSLIFLLFTGYYAISFSQKDYYISGEDLEGNEIKQNDVLFINDIRFFEVKSKNDEVVDIQSIKWEIHIQKQDENFTSILSLSSIEPTYQLQLYSENLIDLGRSFWNSMKRMPFENGKSVYFRANVNCSLILNNNEDITLDFPIYLNLLPAKPVLNILGTFFDEIPPYMWVRCSKTERALELYMTYALYDNLGFRLVSITSPCSVDIYEYKILLQDDWDGNEIIVFCAENQFGYGAISDEISVNDINVLVSIPNHKKDDLFIYPNPAKNFITICYENLSHIESISFFDITGKLCKKVLCPKSKDIDISGLSNGIYSLSINLINSSNHKIIKIIKL